MKKKVGMITLSLVGIIAVYFIAFLMAYSGILNLSNIRTVRDLIEYFPSHYYMLLMMCFTYFLALLRKQLKNKIVRILLMYMAVISGIGVVVSFVLFVGKLFI